MSIRFLQFANLEGNKPTTGHIDKVLEAIKTLENDGAPKSKHLVVGTQVGQANTIQIAAQNYPQSLLQHLTQHLGAPTLDLTITFTDDHSAPFSPTGALTKPVMEFVFNWFPVSQVTPDFQAQIQSDFDQFNSLAGFPEIDAGHGRDMAYGWVDGEQEHEDIEGKKAKIFVVARGWESMDVFQNFMATEKAKESLPVIMAWGVPFKMWHVERRAGIDADASS